MFTSTQQTKCKTVKKDSWQKELSVKHKQMLLPSNSVEITVCLHPHREHFYFKTKTDPCPGLTFSPILIVLFTKRSHNNGKKNHNKKQTKKTGCEPSCDVSPCKHANTQEHQQQHQTGSASISKTCVVVVGLSTIKVSCFRMHFCGSTARISHLSDSCFAPRPPRPPCNNNNNKEIQLMQR